MGSTNSKKMLAAVCLGLLMFVLRGVAEEAPAAATAAPQFQAGVNYDVLAQPVRTRNSDKIEVVEVFWYGCPHCYHFDPLVNNWKQKQADDVDFWRSPAMWNGVMKVHAQAFYTAKALGVLDKLHNPLFTSLVVERKRLGTEEELADLFAAYGVDKKQFSDTFKSFGVVSQVKQADARARSYMISGTPELVVNGKYRVSSGKAGGQQEMLEVVDFLVNKERQAMAAAAP